MKVLRRNDDAMKCRCRYHKNIATVRIGIIKFLKAFSKLRFIEAFSKQILPK